MILFMQVGQWEAEPPIFTSLGAFRQGGSPQGLLQLTPHVSSPSPQGLPRLGCLTPSPGQSLLEGPAAQCTCEKHKRSTLGSSHFRELQDICKPQPHPTLGFQDTAKHNPIFGNSKGIWTVTLPACLHLLKPAQKTGIHTWSA